MRVLNYFDRVNKDEFVRNLQMQGKSGPVPFSVGLGTPNAFFMQEYFMPSTIGFVYGNSIGRYVKTEGVSGKGTVKKPAIIGQTLQATLSGKSVSAPKIPAIKSDTLLGDVWELTGVRNFQNVNYLELTYCNDLVNSKYQHRPDKNGFVYNLLYMHPGVSLFCTKAEYDAIEVVCAGSPNNEQLDLGCCFIKVPTSCYYAVQNGQTGEVGIFTCAGGKRAQSQAEVGKRHNIAIGYLKNKMSKYHRLQHKMVPAGLGYRYNTPNSEFVWHS